MVGLTFPDTLHYVCIPYSHRVFINHFSISEINIYVLIFLLPSKMSYTAASVYSVFKTLGVKSNKPTYSVNVFETIS